MGVTFSPGDRFVINVVADQGIDLSRILPAAILNNAFTSPWTNGGYRLSGTYPQGTPPYTLPVGGGYVDQTAFPPKIWTATLSGINNGSQPGKALPVPIHVLCPQGQTYVNGRCVSIPQHILCPVNQAYINGRCVTIHCAPGQVLVNGQCVQSTGEAAPTTTTGGTVTQPMSTTTKWAIGIAVVGAIGGLAYMTMLRKKHPKALEY